MTFFVRSTAAIAGLLLAGFASEAQAAPVNYADTYWGGNDGTFNADVVAAPGDTRFNISSMDVERVVNDLRVVINTNYANHVGVQSTRLGTLFIGDPTKLNYNGAGAGPMYNDDVFTADTDRFSYAFDYDATNPGNLSDLSDSGSLYALSGTGNDVKLSQDLTTAGQFRRNQAVDIRKSGPNAATDTGINGIWTIGVGTVSFNISNFFGLSGLPAIYQTGLTLAWAMTCANDIIVAQVTFPGGDIPDVPLPASLILLFSGLAGLGFLGRIKAKA